MNNKKRPCIPPILHEHKFIMYIKQKAEMFNSFFVNQFAQIDDKSKPLAELEKKIQNALTTVILTENYTEKSIRKTSVFAC